MAVEHHHETHNGGVIAASVVDVGRSVAVESSCLSIAGGARLLRTPSTIGPIWAAHGGEGRPTNGHAGSGPASDVRGLDRDL